MVQNHPEEFYKQFDYTLQSRDIYNTLKNTPNEYLTDIQKSYKFFYLFKYSFSNKITSQAYGYSKAKRISLNSDKLKSIIDNSMSRLKYCNIENLNYPVLLEKYDSKNTFFYLDPPYFGSENYYGKNIFNKDDFITLSKILKNIQGKFLLSINEDPFISDTFKDFHIKEISTSYSIGKDNHKLANELFICNY